MKRSLWYPEVQVRQIRLISPNCRNMTQTLASAIPISPPDISAETLWSNAKAFSVLSMWVALNILLALLNKSLFRMNFAYPILTSSLHMILAFILSNTALKMNWIRRTIDLSPEQSTRLDRILFYFSFIYVLNIAFGNISLQIVNIPLSQILRTTIPYSTMLMSYFILGSSFSLPVVLSVLPVSCGVALTVYGNVDFSVNALVIIGIGILLASFKVTIANKYLCMYKGMHPVEFLARIKPLRAAGLLLILATIQGETRAFLHQLIYEGFPPAALLVALTTGLCAFLLNWSNFLSNRLTSPLTMCIAGNIKQLVTVMLSIYVFSTELHWWNMMGIIIALIGLAVYSYLKYSEQVRLEEMKETKKE